MPRPIEAASPAHLGARLEPQCAEQEHADDRVGGAVRARDLEKQHREQDQAADSEQSKRKPRLKQIEDRFERTRVRPHRAISLSWRPNLLIASNGASGPIAKPMLALADPIRTRDRSPSRANRLVLACR